MRQGAGAGYLSGVKMLKGVENRFGMKAVNGITVIIPVYNGSAYLARAVNSCLSASPSPDKIIIVDDGSTDGSAEIGRNLQEQHLGKVLFIESDGGVRHGVSAARNRGIRAAGTEWIAFLDCDDYYYPHRFEEFQTACEEGRSFDAMYHACEIVFEKGYVPSGHWQEGLCGVLEPLTTEPLLRTLLFSRSWIPAGVVIRRELLLRAGLFDESLSIGEDCHLWTRTVCLGTFMPGNLKQPVAAYCRHGENVTDKSNKTRLYTIELAWSLLRWARGCNEMPRDRMGMLRKGFASLLVDCLIFFRENGQYQQAWRAVDMARKADPSVFCGFSVLRQMQALFREDVKQRVGTKSRQLEGELHER